MAKKSYFEAPSESSYSPLQVLEGALTESSDQDQTAQNLSLLCTIHILFW